MSPTSHIDPGVVIAQSAPVSGLLDLGCYPDGLDQRGEQISAALNASTFHSVARPDVMRWKYTKLLMNLANSVEAAVTPDPKVKELVKLARAEGEACLTAAGIDFASSAEDKERRGDRMHVQPVNGEFRGGGSSWQSLARGTRSIEADYLNGEIALLGRVHGVPTPANALMQRVANEQARIGAPPQSVPVEQILALLQ
jgi:2-dehydropantoate 2-reductase